MCICSPHFWWLYKVKLEDYKPMITLTLLKKFLSASHFSGCIVLHVCCIFPPSSSPDFLTWSSVQENQQQRTVGLQKLSNVKNRVPTNLVYETWTVQIHFLKLFLAWNSSDILYLFRQLVETQYRLAPSSTVPRCDGSECLSALYKSLNLAYRRLIRGMIYKREWVMWKLRTAGIFDTKQDDGFCTKWWQAFCEISLFLISH
jgi:hypothetical protein